jgi:hypothetical protein
MQFFKLLRENEFCCDFQCLDQKRTLINEEQYVVVRFVSSWDVASGGIGRRLVFLDFNRRRHGEKVRIVDQLLTLATFFNKLTRFISTRKMIIYNGRLSKPRSKHQSCSCSENETRKVKEQFYFLKIISLSELMLLHYI